MWPLTKFLCFNFVKFNNYKNILLKHRQVSSEKRHAFICSFRWNISLAGSCDWINILGAFPLHWYCLFTHMVCALCVFQCIRIQIHPRPILSSVQKVSVIFAAQFYLKLDNSWLKTNPLICPTAKNGKLEVYFN